MEPAGTIADRAYAPKPGAPARPAIVREARQQLAGGENSTGETLLTQNRKHHPWTRSLCVEVSLRQVSHDRSLQETDNAVGHAQPCLAYR